MEIVDLNGSPVTPQPFDLLGFRDMGILGKIVTLGEKLEIGVAQFSHVGIVITAEVLDHPNLDPKKIYVFESTTSLAVPGADTPPDALTGHGYLGVQLRELPEVIASYEEDGASKVALCRLRNNPWNEKAHRPTLRTTFTRLFKTYYHAFYEMSAITMAASLFPELRSVRKARHELIGQIGEKLEKWGFATPINPNKWQFCSELVARTYQAIGMLPLTIEPENVVPIDFLVDGDSEVPRIVDDPVYLKIRKNS